MKQNFTKENHTKIQTHLEDVHKTGDVISDFRRDVNEICALLGCYAVYSGNSLPAFRDNVPVSSSRFKKSKKETFIS